MVHGRIARPTGLLHLARLGLGPLDEPWLSRQAMPNQGFHAKEGSLKRNKRNKKHTRTSATRAQRTFHSFVRLGGASFRLLIDIPYGDPGQTACHGSTVEQLSSSTVFISFFSFLSVSVRTFLSSITSHLQDGLCCRTVCQDNKMLDKCLTKRTTKGRLKRRGCQFISYHLCFLSGFGSLLLSFFVFTFYPHPSFALLEARLV